MGLLADISQGGLLADDIMSTHTATVYAMRPTADAGGGTVRIPTAILSNLACNIQPQFSVQGRGIRPDPNIGRRNESIIYNLFSMTDLSGINEGNKVVAGLVGSPNMSEYRAIAPADMGGQGRMWKVLMEKIT